MKQMQWLGELSQKNDAKIILLIIDGIGDIPNEKGLTPLEAANTPNLDQLAEQSLLGMSTPVRPGITPGSGPAHLGLFGYDPLEWDIGRGVLESLGIDFELGPNDLAARGNFATIDSEGLILDRRAGRIPTEECERITKKLSQIKIDCVKIFVKPVKEYRFVLVLRSPDLVDGLKGTDPQKTGVPSLPVEAIHPEAEKTAILVNEWITQARELLKDEEKANSLNLRGIAKKPDIPQLPSVTKMKLGAIATYPMYRGLASLCGMTVIPTGTTISEEVETLRENWDSYDYFFFHVKKTDSYGEDGDFENKKKVIEKTDKIIPKLFKLNPDVLVVTGDHSTPCPLKSHSWHEVPTMIWSKHNRKDAMTAYTEKTCMKGGLGHIKHQSLLPLMMAHSLKLKKYGA
ncbi:MAG: 2,3-bisphosphoglycerate-independent phosphoglycerate mutase [Patescibacteria group bacterium]|nr:2,3-bisphosphoglycerate-independent phosphoglycerate mutase [Patescibacteria group bacterium]